MPRTFLDSIVGTNTTDVTNTTAQDVVATASVGTGKRLLIANITVTNKTAAETPVIQIKDDSGNVLDTFAPGAGPTSVYRQYVSKIPVPAGEGVTAEATTATGDCLVTVNGDLVST